MEDPESEFKNDGLSLKELLSQGVDDPLGLESFCCELTSGRNLNSSGYQDLNSSTPIPEKHLVLQSDTEIVIDDDGDSMHSLLCLELGNFETGGDEWRGKERPTLDQGDNASMDQMKLDLDLDVSTIVDEVLKEEDKSYIFEDDSEKWRANLEISSIAGQEIYQGWVNDPQLDGAVLNGDPTTVRELSLQMNTDVHSPSFFAKQYSYRQEEKTITSTTIRSVVISEPCVSTQTRFAHRTCVNSDIEFNPQTSGVEKIVQAPPNGDANTEQMAKKVVQTWFKRPARPTLVTSLANADINRDIGQMSQTNTPEETEKHIFLSASQILVTNLFPTAILVPQPIRRVKVVPTQAALRKMVPNDDLEDNDTRDSTIDCVDCGKRLPWPCLAHTLGLVLDTPVIRNGSLKDRAKYTLPWPLELKQSKVRGAGIGVWSSAHLPRGLIFGPYEGIIVTTAPSPHSVAYSWVISRSGWAPFFVDATNPSFSNWLRFVNCGRTAAENNLEAIQYRGQIYYRTIRGIERGSELMVWYGDAFGRELGIERGSRRWYGSQASQVIQCSECAQRFNQESDLYHHHCHSPSSTSMQKMCSVPTQAKRRGRPRKAIKESLPTSLKFVTEMSPSSSSKHVFMNIISEEKSANFQSSSRELPKEVCFASNSMALSGNRGVCDLPSPSGVFFSPRRTRGAIRKTEAQQMTPKSRNKAVKSVKRAKFLSKAKSVLEPGSHLSGEDTFSFEPHGTKCEIFSPPQAIKEECKGKMVITTFSKSLKQIKTPFQPIEAEDSKNPAGNNASSSSHFQCCTCRVTCENHLEVLEHDLSHLKTWPLQCGLCLKRFKAFEDLYQHFCTMLPSDVVVEGSPIASVKTLQSPVLLQELEEKKLLTCKKCQDLLRHTKNLVVILKDHLINSHQSGFTNLFNEINALDPTIFLNIVKENFPSVISDSCCPICFEFLELKDVKRHLTLHSKLISIQRCNLCYAWFPSRPFLDDHSECHKHCLRLLDMPWDKIKVVDMINQLPTSFLSRLQLQLSTSRDAPCNLEQTAERATQLNQPLDQSRAYHKASLSKTNKKERKALQCNVPKDVNDSKRTITDRTVVPTRQRFSCSGCNLAFDSSLTLKRHKLIHKVPSPCKVCHKSFETTFLLKQHRKIHRKVITYDCKRCEKTFRTKSSYLFHISTHATPLSTVFTSLTASSIFPSSIDCPSASTSKELEISQYRNGSVIDFPQYQASNAHHSHTLRGESHQKDALIRIGVRDAILHSNSTTTPDNAADIDASISQLSEMVQQHLECISPL